MKIIDEKKFQYVLMEDKGSWYLTFLSGGPVEIDFCIELVDEEIELIKISSENIKRIIRNVQGDPDSLQKRRVVPSIWP